MMHLPSYNERTDKKPARTFDFGRRLTRPLEPMPKSKESLVKSDAARAPFPTIDEAREKALELAAILTKLGEQRHPLDVRKGSILTDALYGKRVEHPMPRDGNSRQVKAKGRYYFFDVVETKEAEPYLRITESRGKGKERTTLVIFAEFAEAFAQAVVAMTTRLRTQAA